MKIHLIAFRGTGGFDDPKYEQERALIKAGHVGFQLEGDPVIYGFHPSPEAANVAGGEEKLVVLLKNHVAQPGYIQDDTKTFERAYTLHQRGERTEVLELVYEVSEAEFEEIHRKLREWYNTKREFQYDFPQEGGGFPEGEYNCATFPQLLGIPIPSQSGLIFQFVAIMRQQGAEAWQPKSNA